MNTQHTDLLLERNAELEKELEIKNRELEIEAALERLRARTMAMHQSPELAEAASVMFEQLSLLGISLWICGFTICKKDNEIVETWMSPPDGKVMDAIFIPFTIDQFSTAAYEAWKNQEQIYTDIMEGVELQQSHEELLRQPSMEKARNYIIENGIALPTWVQRFAVPYTFGYLMIVATRLFEETGIFLRFAKVFDQTYTRFLDLQRAEAQAREAKIEAALERVRSRSMAMHKSDEVMDVAVTVYDELQKLDFKFGAATIIIMDEKNGNMEHWLAGFIQKNHVESYQVNNSEHPLHAAQLAEWREGAKFVSIELSGSALKSYAKEMFTQSGYRNLPDEEKAMLSENDHAVFNLAYMSHGALMWAPSAISDEKAIILQRFAKVFEQTYTRFLDLQKAEAQTKEAQIEVAVERVRAKALAMHRSEEIMHVVQTLRDELGRLNIEGIFSASIHLKQDDGTIRLWDITIHDVHDNAPNSSWDLNFRLEEMHPSLYIRRIWDATEKYFVFEQDEHDFPILIEWVRQFKKEDADDIDRAIKEYNIKRTWFAAIQLDYGRMNIELLVPPSAEVEFILFKMGAAFDLTYKRFLDLQKAEAQAREAQIELALERVRARTMAMQRSDELQDAANLLFLQVQALHIPVWSCGYNIWEKEEKQCTGWMSSEGFIQPPFKIPLTENPIFIRFYESRKKGESFYAEEVGGAALAAHYQYMLTLPDFAPIAEKHVKAGFPLPSFQINHVANFAQGNLIFITSKPVPEACEVFQRFAKVFEQTYTRFLDLQKAEAQTREAQIELGLERVRARAMAMQTSEELKELIGTVFTELTKLDLILIGSVIIIFDPETNSSRWWMVNSNAPSEPLSFFIRYHEHTPYQEFIKAWKERKLRWEYELQGSTKKEWDEFLFTQTELASVPAPVIAGMKTPERILLSTSFNNFGCLNVGSLNPLTEEQFDILLRFAKVFDLTYTRFNDLQKAEAQAREARIEAALEKIRSRSLAMHHSGELKDVVEVMFKKLDELKVLHGTVAIQLFDFTTKDSFFWPGNTLNEEPPLVKLPFDESIMNEDTCYRDLWQAMISGEAIFNKVYSRKQKDRWFQYVFDNNDLATISSESRQFILQAETHTVCFIPLKNSALFADSWDGSLFSEDDFRILKKAVKVFEQAYIRFLDLQRAEAQAREAQIELGLERIRARAMAMQKSDELAEAAKRLYNELRALNINPVSCGYMFINEEQQTQTAWVTLPDGTLLPDYIVFPLTGDLILNDRYKGWKQKEPLHKAMIEGEVNKEHHRFLSSHVPANISTEIFAHIPENIVFYSANFSAGYLMIIATKSFSAEEEQTIIRFAKVFEITYTRFLDLQRAEAQAREAQIELAMERVRARTMAMQKSGELADVAGLLFKQVSDLGIKAWTTGFNVWSDDNNYYTDYITSPQGGFIEPYTINATSFPAFKEISDARKRGKEFFVSYLEGEMLKETYLQLSKFGDERQYEKMLEGGFQFPSRQFNHFVFGSKVSLMFITYEPVPEAHAIFQRFGKVFEQTYTRFLDLQKAEAQAREAQVETAMERVRARTMAMQKSDELAEVAAILFKQVNDLGIKTWTTGFNVWSEDNNSWTDYVTNPRGGFIEPYIIDATEFSVFIEVSNAKKRGDEFYVQYLEGEMLKETYRQLSSFANKKQFEKLLEEGFEFPSHQYHHFVFGAKVSLMFITYEPIPEAHDIFKRFGKVFEQTYIRFLDLQKAEAQARESQIQLALERVRARTMAMQRSEELKDTALILFQHIQELGVHSFASGVHLWEEDRKAVTVWSCTEGEMLPPFKVPLTEDPALKHIYEAREREETFHVEEMGGEALIDHYKYMFSLPFVKEIFGGAGLSLPTFHIFHAAYFANGYLLFITHQPCPEAYEIFKRFAAVFEQTYTRFLDLQRAEAQARESQIQLALERIRGRSLAMHHSNELKDVVAILFQQLKILGLEFDGGAAIHLFSEGSRDAVILVASPLALPMQVNLPFDKEAFVNNPIILDLWHAKETGENIFNRFYSFEEKNKYFEYVFKHNSLETLPQSARNFILEADSYTASFIAEKNSLLGANSWSRQLFSKDDFDVLKRIAKVFEQAYIRFLDLQKAEALAIRAEQDLIEIKSARKKAEDTLTELRATQAQLIQKEKMASLGELTAGIAHEIQNPLNFVNNFSEVNTELVSELKEEIDKGNIDEVRAIANDIKENEQKINHHGKRADAIVKGMLLHSRASTGKKESTDINALADEYLRLSYHGLRAKDKDFNADFKTNFGESIAKIEVVPQEIGRVLLNLYNNAFYAVNEKKKMLDGPFEPLVSVTTKRVDNKIELSVRDNGTGIPRKVLDKIYQPFFTTKPTGQGTGLGLSLSYDIIKAHGGEIRVESKEGEGSEFAIYLPTKENLQ